MNAKRILLIGIFTGAIIASALVVYLIVARPGAVSPAPEESLPTPSAPVVITPPPALSPPTDDTFVIQTPSGGVAVRNFYKDNPVIYGDVNVMLATGGDYHIQYERTQGQFFIGLLARTREQARSMRVRAEDALLEKLGISRQEACKLEVSVAVPGSWNLELAGVNYGLSFCPGAVAL
jgi:hypothetical protein